MQELTYKELITLIHSKEPNPNYYQQLTQHSHSIVMQVAITNQGVVARDLKMSASKLSYLMPLFKEFARASSSPIHAE